ncbi:hypothetical protein ACFFMN_36800 [Planobispora siamensis]|uniref:Uncharacterized protein n=1 Tax=Planobispora siamensis TaxID=936338 RepID=A0A8J3SQ38_9ACTN|nr:hypothetical protein [Planobispora siamensis]GIH96696.1 hypothetical protein Psi01_73260 [Planobispora siamensis]
MARGDVERRLERLEKLVSRRNVKSPGRVFAAGIREFMETRDVRSADRPLDETGTAAEPPDEEAVTTPLPAIARPEETTG